MFSDVQVPTLYLRHSGKSTSDDMGMAQGGDSTQWLFLREASTLLLPVASGLDH